MIHFCWAHGKSFVAVCFQVVLIWEGNSLWNLLIFIINMVSHMGGRVGDVCEDIWFIYKRRVDRCYLCLIVEKLCDVQFHLDLIVDLWGDIIKLQSIKKLTILWSLNILPVSVIFKLKSLFSFSLRLGFLSETEINLFCGRWIANDQSGVKHAIVSLTLISRDSISKGYTSLMYRSIVHI